MERILSFACLNKILDNNVVFVFVHLQSSSGKAIKEFLRELVFVNSVVNKKIFVKFVLLILNLVFQWISETKDVEKMVLILLMITSLVKIIKKQSLHLHRYLLQLCQRLVKKNWFCLLMKIKMMMKTKDKEKL